LLIDGDAAGVRHFTPIEPRRRSIGSRRTLEAGLWQGVLQWIHRFSGVLPASVKNMSRGAERGA